VCVHVFVVWVMVCVCVCVCVFVCVHVCVCVCARAHITYVITYVRDEYIWTQVFPQRIRSSAVSLGTLANFASNLLVTAVFEAERQVLSLLEQLLALRVQKYKY
jgi:hypothetical protein